MLPKCLSPQQLATRWGCTRGRIYELIDDGTLKAITTGKKREFAKILPESIEEAEQQTLAVKPAPKKRAREYVPKQILADLEKYRKRKEA